MLDLDSLTTSEAVAFAVLLRALLAADGELSEEERPWLSAAATAIGAAVFRQAESIDVSGEARFVGFLGTVTRPLARNIIYDALLAAAQADGIQAEETRLLDAVAHAWDIVTLESHEPTAG